MEKIALDRKYQVKDWQQDGIQQLLKSKRERSLEAMTSSLDRKCSALLKLYRIRAERRYGEKYVSFTFDVGFLGVRSGRM
jgi:hypothetical protein